MGRATMMGHPCVRLAGRFLASYDIKAGCLVVKLPRERVTELVEQGAASRSPLPARSSASGWRSPPSTATLWQQVLAEAVEFARLGLAG